MLYIHPTHPVGVEAMTDFWLMPLVGFLMDTTLAAAKLVFSGVPERFPRIRWALCHLGGAIPYLAERLDRGFDAFSECRAHIPRPPSEYLKNFYYDTVNFNPRAMQLAIDFAGADHILAGSDYPHQIGSIPKMLEIDPRDESVRPGEGGDLRRQCGAAAGDVRADARLTAIATMLKRISTGLWFALLFVFLGLPFLTLPGLHADAASELAGFYPCSLQEFKARLFGYDVPLMVLPYLGSLKAWVYLPILSYLEVTAVALRLPLLLAGAASVAMFFALADRTLGRRAAVAGTLLLATDASFVIATSIDFGPIVLLHFFLLAGILLVVRFDRTGSLGILAAAFFLFGLALWHKALFAWMLAGLAAGALAVFPKRIWAKFTWKRLAVAVLSLCLGAAPLLYYNAVTRGRTLRTGDIMSARTSVGQKLLVLRKTMDGSILFGFLTEERGNPGRGVHSDAMWYAFLAAGCLLPWLWFTPSRHAALFAAVYLAAAWTAMAANARTGGSLHHAILLWPFPQFLIAAAGAELSRRFGRVGTWGLAAALVPIAGSNVLLLNQYRVRLTTAGPSAVFTDAVQPLSDYLSALGPGHFVTVDWGYADTLCLLSDGEMDIDDASYSLQSRTGLDRIRSLIVRPRTVFVARTPADEVFPGVRTLLNSTAAEMGYSPGVVQVIDDRHRRPRFEVIRFAAKP